MLRYKKSLIILGAAITLFIALTAGLSMYDRVHSGLPREILIGKKTLVLTLALTESEKEIGLSGFSSLPDDQGMLFIFDTPDYWAFWMKDMTFPIDMIWLDEKGRVVDIKSDADPAQFPEVYTPRARALSVLEAVSGFAKKNNVTVGEQTEFSF